MSADNEFAIILKDGTVFVFDALISQQFAINIETPEFPLEEGADVIDHAQSRPFEIHVSGIVTETPFASTPNVSTSPALFGIERTRAATTFLLECEAQPLYVQTPREGGFSDMLLTSMTYDVTTKRSVQYNLSFRQARFAEAASVEIPVSKPRPAVRNQVCSPQDMGTQTAEFVDYPESDNSDYMTQQLPGFYNAFAREHTTTYSSVFDWSPF